MTQQRSNDALLIGQIRKADPRAWQQLIERYEGRLLAFVESRLGDRATSEDVVQETFVGFLTSLPHFDENRDLEAYLFSIAAHKLTDQLRRQGRRGPTSEGRAPGSGHTDDEGRPLDELAGPARPASSIARSGERHQVEEQILTDCLGQLIGQWTAKGDFERLKCLELLLVKGWANKDVARFLSITEQAVASAKHQAITKLKEMVQRSGLSGERFPEFQQA